MKKDILGVFNLQGLGRKLQSCEVWWARLKPPAGRRPVVPLSRDEAYPVRTAVTVAPVTTTTRGIAVQVSLGLEDGLPKPCALNCDSIWTKRPQFFVQSQVQFSWHA